MSSYFHNTLERDDFLWRNGNLSRNMITYSIFTCGQIVYVTELFVSHVMITFIAIHLPHQCIIRLAGLVSDLTEHLPIHLPGILG